MKTLERMAPEAERAAIWQHCWESFPDEDNLHRVMAHCAIRYRERSGRWEYQIVDCTGESSAWTAIA